MQCEQAILSDCICNEFQIPSNTYEFPARPGTTLWESLTSSMERINACQIPEEVLLSMSTEALVETCSNYPLLRELIFSNLTSGGLQSSMDFFFINFNGFIELSQRSNSGQVLLNKYLVMNPCCFIFSDDKGRFINSFSEYEMIIAQSKFINMLSKENLIKLLSKSIYCLKQKMLYSDSYSLVFGINTSALIASRTLQKLDYAPFTLELERNPQMKNFTGLSSIPSSESDVNRLFSLIEMYCTSYLDHH